MLPNDKNLNKRCYCLAGHTGPVKVKQGFNNNKLQQNFKGAKESILRNQFRQHM